MQINFFAGRFSSSRDRGFTLIEVLIALAITAIALTAIIKATSQAIRSTTHLQQKTIALWVAQDILNSARVNLIKLPIDGVEEKQPITMLNQSWWWQGYQENTPIKSIKKIQVYVFDQADEEATPLVTLKSYVYHEPK